MVVERWKKEEGEIGVGCFPTRRGERGDSGGRSRWWWKPEKKGADGVSVSERKDERGRGCTGVVVRRRWNGEEKKGGAAVWRDCSARWINFCGRRERNRGKGRWLPLTGVAGEREEEENGSVYGLNGSLGWVIG
ncbi:hypothetical protein HAX54_018839 [Datura stramonium]|uniref:Uncharacterized protein n=1 Tax=Datura stramonium TaxID=4076 RepID=A0ABS8UQF6_DATST|nr:hypothetical protein [Datura stramonium]